MTIENLTIETTVDAPAVDSPPTLAVTTGNERKQIKTVKPLPFDADDVFKVVGTVPRKGDDPVKALFVFAQKTGTLDMSAGSRGSMRAILKSLLAAYEHPGTMNQGEIASVVASGVQNQLFKACWEYCQKFSGAKVPVKNDGRRGKVAIDFTGRFQNAVNAVLDPAQPDNLTNIPTALDSVDLSTL